MIWLMENLKISQEEQIVVNYYVIKHLILLRIQNVTDIKQILLLWLTKF